VCPTTCQRREASFFKSFAISASAGSDWFDCVHVCIEVQTGQPVIHPTIGGCLACLRLLTLPFLWKSNILYTGESHGERQISPLETRFVDDGTRGCPGGRLGAGIGPSHEVNFTAGGGKSTFAFRWNKGMIFVPIRLNGSPPLSFVLDTDSTRTIVDRAVATSLGLKTSGSSSLQGAGAGRIPIEFIHDVSVTLPGIESAGFELSTADLQPLKASLGI
jgi:Aspartyl protease